MVFCPDLIFFFKQLDTFLLFFNCNQTKLFFFLPSQNSIFFLNALYKGVSQYSFLDANLKVTGQRSRSQLDLSFSHLTVRGYVMLCVAFVIVLSVYYQMFIALQEAAITLYKGHLQYLLKNRA